MPQIFQFDVQKTSLAEKTCLSLRAQLLSPVREDISWRGKTYYRAISKKSYLQTKRQSTTESRYVQPASAVQSIHPLQYWSTWEVSKLSLSPVSQRRHSLFESGPRLAEIMIQHLPKVGQTAAKKNSTDTASIIEDSFLNRVPNLVQIVIHCRRNAWQSAPVLRDQYNTFRRRHLSQHTSIQPRQFKVLVRSQCPLSNQIFAFQQPKKCFPVRRTDSRVAPTLN